MSSVRITLLALRNGEPMWPFYLRFLTEELLLVLIKPGLSSHDWSQLEYPERAARAVAANEGSWCVGTGFIAHWGGMGNSPRIAVSSSPLPWPQPTLLNYFLSTSFKSRQWDLLGKEYLLDNEAKQHFSPQPVFIKQTTTVPLIQGDMLQDTWWMTENCSPYIHYVFPLHMHTCERGSLIYR